MEFIEHSLIPFEPKLLRGEKLLVLAPHPDDEVIGCGGLIAQHTAEGRSVRVLIATDGSAAAQGEETESYREKREIEARTGLRFLGAEAPIFLRFPDRGLAGVLEELKDRLLAEITEFRPDLVAVPGPIEIHPDHQALSRALFQIIEEHDELARSLAVTRVAFYEVSQPIRPNLLLDITAEADRKWEAVAAHQSQGQLRAYQSFARGLNQYRAMTLPGSVLFAEGYAVHSISELRHIDWSTLSSKISGTQSIEVIRETLPITVVIRTRNRLGFLEEALESVEANSHPARVVVVNDGGESPKDRLAHRENVSLIEHAVSRGRSEAMNAGVREATTDYIAFLDDDDRFYPDHLQTLANAAGKAGHAAYYSDALSVFLAVDQSGDYPVSKSMRIFAQDYDRDLLLVDNYIPLPTTLIRRADFLDLGGFDPSFDLFEDWDFLIRLSKRGSFLRIPRLTCEIRHVATGDSVTLATPEGSPGYTKAKLDLWEKHRNELTLPLFAKVLEKQKRRTLHLYTETVEQQGRASHLERDINRLQREKELLLTELKVQTDLRFASEGELAAIRRQMEELEGELKQTRTHLFEVRGEAAAAISELDKHQVAVKEQERTIQQLYGEIERLNGLLASIYRSRTWRLHRFVEAVRGKTE